MTTFLLLAAAASLAGVFVAVLWPGVQSRKEADRHASK